MKVGITGATGFLGSHHCESWLEAGHEVVGVVRTPSKGAWLAERGVELRKADLTDPEALTAAFSGIDVLVANAALAPGRREVTEEALRTANITGTRNTLQAAADAGVKRVIYISSVSVYRTRLLHKIQEHDAQIDPDSHAFDLSDLTTNPGYSRTKAAAEREAWSLATTLGLDLTVVRPGPIYGPRDYDLTARYLTQLNSRVQFAPVVRAPHIHARDVADAVRRAAERDLSIGKVYNLTAGAVSPFTILRTLRRLQGHGAVVVPVAVPLWVDFDDSAAERDLGATFRSIEDGLRDVLENHPQ